MQYSLSALQTDRQMDRRKSDLNSRERFLSKHHLQSKQVSK